MPNGSDHLDPDDRALLELPLRDLDPALADFATRHGATVGRGGQPGMPAREVTAGDADVDSAAAPQRTLRVVARYDFANPTYDICIIGFAHRGRQAFDRRRLLAGAVADTELPATFGAVAEAAWAEAAAWTVADLPAGTQPFAPPGC